MKEKEAARVSARGWASACWAEESKKEKDQRSTFFMNQKW
jgi:hypothetical protein